MMRILLPVLIFCILSSCESKESANFSGDQRDTTSVLIRPSHILKADDFETLVATPRQMDKANWCTEQSYRLEEDNISMAIHYQIKAITFHPTSTRYIRLANLYLQNAEYCNASEAYQFIFRRFPDGTDDMLYDLMYCSLMGNCNDNLYFINQIAIEKEIDVNSLIAKAESDLRLAQITNTANYSRKKKSMLQYYDCGDTISFSQYLSYFEPIKFPYTINDRNVGQGASELNDGMECDVDIDTFLAGNIENWTKYEMLSIVYKGDYGVTVLYEGDSSNYEDRKDLKNTFFKIVSYNKNGKILCDTNVAWRVGASERHCVISSDLTVKTEDFERVFKRPYDQKDKENELLEVKPTDAGSFRINPTSGCFTEAP